jgi:hypothetical protein
MKYLIIALITLVILSAALLTTGSLTIYEDGSYIYSADIPFSQAWRD